MFSILRTTFCALFLGSALLLPTAHAGVGDPQIRTDHPWYPGELASSTFERLFATQAEQYERATARKVDSDEHKALASWFWRNTHYAHGEEGAENIWGDGFTSGDLRTREYWTGLFAHGFGLCGTTHSQWTAEIEQLIGHARGRGVGAAGHNAFEIWLTGGAYGAGQWALIDHDLSTVIYDASGKRILSLPEVKANWKELVRRDYLPQKQQGWLVCGLHPGDGASYAEYTTAEYLPGYAGPPPMIHLRRGETFRRYFEPGLESGKEFVFWGRNYNTDGIPGPERNHTWINQPDQMFGSRTGAGSKSGQVRFANAVFTYQPNFSNGDYREAIIEETDSHLTFEFTSPYIIAATPPNAKEWGIYEPGCRNGLVLSSRTPVDVSISTDCGRTWSKRETITRKLDLTDHAKGYRQYRLRCFGNTKSLADTELKIRTVCQVNSAILPRLKDGGTKINFTASNQALYSAGPTKAQAQTHVVDGAFGTPTVTLKIKSPRHEPITTLYAAAHTASGNPPDPNVRFNIDYSIDEGSTWQPMVKDWRIERRGNEPADFWSQSFCYGSLQVTNSAMTALLRFTNTGKRNYLRAEAHAAYKTQSNDNTQVTYHWSDGSGSHTVSQTFSKNSDSWNLPTGKNVRTKWVEFSTSN